MEDTWKYLHRGKSFTCYICDESYTKSHARSRKAWKYSWRRVATYWCKQDKAFLQSGQLKKQEVTHTREKLLVCSKCDRWFLQSSGLKTLQMIHEAEEPFTCTICSVPFTQKSFEDRWKDPHRKEAICLIQMWHVIFTKCGFKETWDVSHKGEWENGIITVPFLFVE